MRVELRQMIIGDDDVPNTIAERLSHLCGVLNSGGVYVVAGLGKHPNDECGIAIAIFDLQNS
jgi:hypothetical protein